MDLDFIFFPAPKEISKDYEQGQILWIPKYPKLYPSFQNYVKRKNQKQVLFIKTNDNLINKQSNNAQSQQQNNLAQTDKNIQESCDYQLSKYGKRLQIITNKDQQKQVCDINQSPIFEPIDTTSDIQEKLEKLNLQSVPYGKKSPTLCRMSSTLFSQQHRIVHKSICYSSPLIKLPAKLLNNINQQSISEMTDDTSDDQKIQIQEHTIIGHIPCMYVDSKIHSPNILIYFHANCEDITISYNFLIYLRDNLQISVIAVEYPGYGIYKNQTPSAEYIQNDAEYVYNYLTKRLGYEESRIIIFGRSIGSGPATYLSSKYKPGCLSLMSPFSSLKAAVRDYIGSWAQFLIRERYDNLQTIKKVTSPIFILHGDNDKIIPFSQAKDLQKSANATSKCILHLAEGMDHINYRLYKDLINPLTDFLLEIKYYCNGQQGPKLPTLLFQEPSHE